MPISWMPKRSSSPVSPPPPKEAIDAFQEFFEANDLPSAQEGFAKTCSLLEIEPDGYHCEFYPRFKRAMKPHVPYKYRDIWKILDKKASQKPYLGRIAEKMRVLVVGAGPCGLRTAIETQLLGAKTIIIERREDFTRHNVLKLWKFLMEDLKSLGAKKMFGMFCTGNINHVGIKKLQLILSKVAMLLGIRIVTPAKLVDLVEPNDEGKGWTAKITPSNEELESYEFNFLVVATGKRVPLDGFDRRSLDAKMSIAITANFVNNKTSEESEVRQISGISKQFHQDFFKGLEETEGIKLENIVYYRGETHYFVMTALKDSLLAKGVIKEDIEERSELLAPSNIDVEMLHKYATDAAQYSCGHFSKKLPETEWAVDGKGNPDCAIFDFTNLYSARNASRVQVRKGNQLLMAIVGDSLLEPFWPEGTGCARGFLSCMDAAWMFRRWAKDTDNPLEILCERENIYRLLTQTTDGSGGNLKDNHKEFTMDPQTRYRSIPTKIDHDRILPLYDSDNPEEFAFIEEKFVKRQYYSREEHKTLLRRLRRGISRQISRIRLPVRVARAFKRGDSGNQGEPVQ